MQVRYTAIAKGNLLLELPPEAHALNLQPGAKIDIIIETENASSAPSKRISARGKYAGLSSVDEFLRRKQEDIDWEDRNLKPL